MIIFTILFLSFSSAQSFSGIATTYNLNKIISGNCNFGEPDPSSFSPASTYYVAINKKQWNNAAQCGKCIKVTSPTTNKSVKVMVLDQCPGCAEGDLDLSPIAFKEITGETSGRFNINWEFVSCYEDLVKGPINYCLKGGSNVHWAAIQPTNFLKPITKMKVNQIEASDPSTNAIDAYYYLVQSVKGLETGENAKTWYKSLEITIESEDGETLTDVISFPSPGGVCSSGKQQFSLTSNSNGIVESTSNRQSSSLIDTTTKQETTDSTTTKQETTDSTTTKQETTDSTPQFTDSQIQMLLTKFILSIMNKGTNNDDNKNTLLNANLKSEGNVKGIDIGIIIAIISTFIFLFGIAFLIYRRKQKRKLIAEKESPRIPFEV